MKASKPKKWVASPEQLANDPSLKYCPYRRMELIWSDELNGDARFVCYEGGWVRLANFQMGEIQDRLFDPLLIRRHTAGKEMGR